MPGFCQSENAGIALRAVSGRIGTWLVAVNPDDAAVEDDVRLPADVTQAWEDKAPLAISDRKIELRFYAFQVRFIKLETMGARP